MYFWGGSYALCEQSQSSLVQCVNINQHFGERKTILIRLIQVKTTACKFCDIKYNCKNSASFQTTKSNEDLQPDYITQRCIVTQI